MELVKDTDLDIEKKSKFLREGSEGPVVVRRCLQEVIDADGCFRRLGGARTKGIVVKFEAVCRVCDFLVACQRDWTMLVYNMWRW
jgi:hypothetical protein